MTCDCKLPGFCPRYGRNMPYRLHQLCQSRSDYRELFARLAAEGKFQQKAEPLTAAEQVREFLASTATFLINGAQQTAKELYDERLAICDSCEELKRGTVFGVARLPQLDSCKQCGCYVRLKAAFPHEACPVGNWQAVTTGSGCGGCGK